MITSRTPTPGTSMSPTTRAMMSPTEAAASSVIGQAITPRSASARRLARMRALAVISHQRLATRDHSVASVAALSKRTACSNSSRVSSLRAKNVAASMARPTKNAGSTTAVFIAVPAKEPSSN